MKRGTENIVRVFGIDRDGDFRRVERIWLCDSHNSLSCAQFITDKCDKDRQYKLGVMGRFQVIHLRVKRARRDNDFVEKVLE